MKPCFIIHYGNNISCFSKLQSRYNQICVTYTAHTYYSIIQKFIGLIMQQFNTSIQAKITIPYLLLSVFTAIGIGIISVRLVLDNVDKRFNNQLYETRIIASVQMQREEDRLLETQRVIANVKGIDQAILERDADELRELIVGIVVNNQEEIIDILDMDGQLLLSMRHKTGGKIEEYDYVHGGVPVYSEWPFVSKVLNGHVDEKGNKFSGYIETEWGDFFYVSGPVFDDNDNQIAVILVGKTLNTIAEEMRAKTLGQITLYSETGEIISSTLFEPKPVSKEISTEVFSFRNEESYRSNPPRREFDFENLSYRELLSSWEIRSGTKVGMLGVALAQNSLITATLATRLGIIALVSLTTFLIIIIGTRLAKAITVPIIELVGASKEVAEGNLNIHIDPKTDDEIRLLSENFNFMVTSLEKSQKDLMLAYDSTLAGWSTALELKDKETEGHTQRVTALTVEFARAYGIPEEEIIHIRRGAILHDIGKMGVPDSILLKPGKLTEEDWVIVKRHPENAYNMLKDIEYLIPALDIPYCHHERWDGKGYPRGIKGEEIPIAARLFSIVDAWDALSSNRPYRKWLSPITTRQTITADKGTRYQPELVDFFMEFIREKIKSKKKEMSDAELVQG